MKFYKLAFLLFILIHASVGFSQTAVVKARLVLNPGDTINEEVKVWINYIDTTLINELSFKKRTWLKRNDGFVQIPTRDIHYLEFVDFKDKQRIFISDKNIPNFEGKGLLFERIVHGRLSWYKQYEQNSYDGGIVVINHYYLEGNKPVTLGAFGATKKRLKELTQEFPVLATEINKQRSDKDILPIIMEFNRLSREKIK